MIHFTDIEKIALRDLVEEYLQGHPGKPHLTPAEHDELWRISQAYTIKESSTVTDTVSETIRSRRKRIYYKLDVSSAKDIQSDLLLFVMGKFRARSSAA